MNVVSVNGGKVHSKNAFTSGGEVYPLCGINMGRSGYRETDAELTCKTCLMYESRRLDARLKELEAKNAEREAHQTQGEIMAETTETDHAATIEQITANIERAQSLAEAENVEGLEELNKETETLISGLPSRGKIPDGSFTFTAYKKAARDDMRKASQAQPKQEAKAGSAVAQRAETAPAKTYADYEGVSELVSMGAEKVAEGVRLHIKASVTAKSIAEIILDMWRRIPDKDGNPDITGKSDAAKKASSALYKAAGEALQGEDEFEVDKSVKSLIRSVQLQRTDVRAKYLRHLDEDSEDAAEERKHFAKLLEATPEDMTASQWLAHHYGVSLKGEIEKARERQRELRGGETEGDSEPDADENPEDEIRSAVKIIRKGIAKVDADKFAAQFEALEDDAQEEIKKELDVLLDALKAMIKATI